MPPGNIILLAFLGAVCRLRWQRLGQRLIIASLAFLYLQSLPFIAATLSGIAQPYPALVATERDQFAADAIVVLAGGLYRNAPEYNDDSINLNTLGRLRYAAQLAKQLQLPVLVSGGVKNPEPHHHHNALYGEAELAQVVLEQEFGLSHVIVEADSQTTRDNAYNSAKLLRQYDLRKVLLVTHALHMPRAVRAFGRAGVEVLPAPTLFFPALMKPPWNIDAWIPTLKAMIVIRFVLHEWLGEVWYWLRDDLLASA